VNVIVIQGNETDMLAVVRMPDSGEPQAVFDDWCKGLHPDCDPADLYWEEIAVLEPPIPLHSLKRGTQKGIAD
jgi:hypothetical protein